MSGSPTSDATGRDWTRRLCHDLKSPAALCVAYSSLLRGALAEIPAGPHLDHLEEIEKAAAQLRERVDRCVDLDLEQTRRHEPQTIDLAGLARETLSRLLADRDLQGAIECDGEPMRVRADPEGAVRLLEELMTNAITHGVTEGPCRLGLRHEAGGRRFVFVDRGPGIDPSLAERAFDPLVRGRAGGAGVGLAIVRTIARRHGGDCGLVREGGGLRVWFELSGPGSPLGPDSDASGGS